MSALAALPALVTVAAWHLHLLPLMQWAPGSVPMQYNTAIGLLCLAAALSLQVADRPYPGQLLALAAVLLGLATVAEHVFWVDLHIDQLFVKAWLIAPGNAAPGRMAANSALCLVIAGLALLPASGAAAPPRRHSALGMALAGSLICAIVLVALLGYLTNIESAYRGSHFNTMEVNTAVSLLLIGAGILTLSLSDAGGGRILHRSWTPALILGIVTVRTLLLWQAIQGEQNLSRVQASQTTASQIGVRVRMSTESLAADVMRLEQRWHEYSPAGDAGWQQDAQSYCRDYPGLRAVEWVGESTGKRRVAGRIGAAWSPKVLEIQAEALQSARRRKTAVASIILDIGQGKSGFLVVAPGLEPGPGSYTTAIIEIQPWLVSIIGNQTALQYGIVVTAGGAEVYRRGSSQSQAIHRAEAQSDVGLAGAGWIVHAWPGSDTSSSSESSLATWVLVAGLVVAAALALAAHLTRLSYDRAKAVEAANRKMEIEILERKLAQESLLAARLTIEEATRAKTDFLTRMSHEIRTPMNAILGMAELLWDSRLDDEQRQYVGAFRRAGDNLLTLINDILDLSKVEAGRIELQSIDFELDELVGATIDLMRVRADDKSLDIVCEISPQIGLRVRGDPGRLRQVLINLLGNALKFTEAGGVRLAIVPEPASPDSSIRVRFSVSDTGPGISLEKQSLIFDAFTQADSSISRNHGGAGLGLTISRQLVERMGGSLEVSSMPGQGSTFTFAIPLTPSISRASLPGSTRNVPAEQPAGNLRILMVEDSKDNQLLICAYLKPMARTLKIACDGRAAVELFTAGVFDLVLMDVQMPVMDGYTATRAIRHWEARQGSRRTPILALSAHAMDEAFEKSLEAGCNAHLTKPIAKATLLRAIAKHCETRDPILIHPPKDTEELAPWYLERRHADMTALAASLQAGDYNAVRIMGHNMKGSGAGYGFDAISRIGASLEAAAKQESAEQIGIEIAYLGDYLDRVQLSPRSAL